MRRWKTRHESTRDRYTGIPCLSAANDIKTPVGNVTAASTGDLRQYSTTDRQLLRVVQLFGIHQQVHN